MTPSAIHAIAHLQLGALFFPVWRSAFTSVLPAGVYERAVVGRAQFGIDPAATPDGQVVAHRP
jgi:hypothetical protein